MMQSGTRSPEFGGTLSLLRASSSSSSSTPPDSSSHDATLSVLDIGPDVDYTYLQDHFHNRIIRDVPVEKFVRHVWGHNFDSIRTLSGDTRVTVPQDCLEDYARSMSDEGCVSGDVVYEILNDIRGQLLRTTYDRLPYGSFDRRNDVDEDENPMPAIVFSSSDDDLWDMMGAFVHVAKTKKIELNIEEDLVVVLSEVRMSSFRSHCLHCLIGCLCQSGSLAGPSNDWHHGESSASESESNLDLVDARPRHNVVDTPVYAVDPRPLRPREAYPAHYISNMLAQGLRTHATGVSIRNTMVTLYYGDRFGLIRSSSFDFIQQPELLVLVVSAITNASSASLGFNPFLRINEVNGGVTLHNSKVEFAVARDCHGQRTGPYSFTVDVSRSRKVYTSGEALGRGTMVVPIRTNNRRASYDGCSADLSVEHYVWKSSFADKGYLAEDQVISHVRGQLFLQRKYDVLNHITELICSVNASLEDIKLPRVFLGDVEGSPSGIFRCLVFPEYEPLSDVTDPDDFKYVVTDVIKGTPDYVASL